MEHIVQFAISFDDETIKRRLENNAYNEIVNNIYETIRSSVERRISPVYRDNDFNKALEKAVLRVVEYHKDEIIEKAAAKVANKINRERVKK